LNKGVIMNKKDMLFDIVVNEYYCMWEIFCENVVADSEEDFKEAYKKCKTREDLRKLVCNYI